MKFAVLASFIARASFFLLVIYSREADLEELRRVCVCVLCGCSAGSVCQTCTEAGGLVGRPLVRSEPAALKLPDYTPLV